MTVRGNESIWRLARWLYNNVDNIKFWSTSRDYYYDKALELYTRLGIVSTLGLENKPLDNHED